MLSRLFQGMVMGDRIMLVLSRKENESLVIGNGIKVTVLKIKGNRITIGIEADRDVRVVRGELPLNEQPQAVGADQ